MPSALLTKYEKARLIILPSLLAALVGILLSNSTTNISVQAFSTGPPAGYTGAPGEEPEACAECHVPSDAGTGSISVTAPQNYVPGQTYTITVTHNNATDPTRLRWGFQLTALDTGDEKAGNLQSTDVFTQILNNQGPGGSRQYIEHTFVGTFPGQQHTASWTFDWTAPPTDVGPIYFYAAGNQANNDENTSGDYIYKTFTVSSPISATADFAINVTPQIRTITPGASASYTVTVTPLAGFTGNVTLSTGTIPAGVTPSFVPAVINLTDANPKTSTLTLNSTAGTPLGNHLIDVVAQAGSLSHNSSVTLRVVSPTSVDLAVNKTASPNPGQVGTSLSYRIVVSNNGPAPATNVSISDTLPVGVTLVSASATQGSCSGSATVNCSVGTINNGAFAIATIVVSPTTPGQLTNTAAATASETDFDPSNNSSTTNTVIQSAAVSPVMLDPNLTVSTVLSGLDQPTSMAFIGNNDFFVLEKASGKVQRIQNGLLHSTVLDLAVNSASERGLLGITLHPNFAVNGYVYLFWSETTTGTDTTNVDASPLLGNRVDRYIWNGTSLTFDRNLIRLRSLQQDSGQSSRGNHNGGVLRFGQDGKLYIIFGDNGRRGLLQNITSGGPVPDDQFGGPEPDDAHMTGVILRLNDDGTTPSDNPFFNATTSLTGEAAANVKKIFAYGVRNSFGMDFDSLTGNLWTQENGDDAFDEINRVRPGFNGGWIQTIGPVNRVAEYKLIESTYGAGNLQQIRWAPSNIADTPQVALSRLYMLPGAQYVDPEFSWKYAVAPSPIGFIRGRGLGPDYEGDLLVGASRVTLANGYLFRFKLSPDRQHFSFSDPDLLDLVADNQDKFDLAESESLLVGRDFGITTDIKTGPNGNVFVVSLSNGAVYEIKSKPGQIFTATLTGTQQVPSVITPATGSATLILSPDEQEARLSLSFSGLTSQQTVAHIHGPAAAGSNAGVLFPLPLGQLSDYQISLTAQQVADLKAGLHYINVHTSNFTNGEIRGQFGSPAGTSAVVAGATSFAVNEGQASASITFTRLGNTSGAATVSYATSDPAGLTNCNVTNGTASSRCDYAASVGTISFAAGESFKTISIPIVDDAYAEGPEIFSISLFNPGGMVLGPPTVATVTINDNETVNGANPIDQTAFFVRQHYIDFLGREPDPPGFIAWQNLINSCPAGDITCDRIHVSAAFFQSPEFQQRGYFVYRFYPVSFGRKPDYTEFIPDLARVSGFLTEAQLEAAKLAFINDFMARPAFVTKFNGLDNTQYVDTLLTTAGVTHPSRDFWIAALGNGTLSRAQVLRLVTESTQVYDKYYNQAFVVMQYFGYLRRDPDALYLNWIAELDATGNARNMINGFVNSLEYRFRFGP
ncbi:MAG TPA: PQQ-dependent sugar dehydrogenase [Pyrinomonadaceae bacterium]|nr:PQQ-dependent sugar dehydrogenase [Pyrinomonadaceae bacterium]